jgi:transcription termination/antitermination protein NusG
VRSTSPPVRSRSNARQVNTPLGPPAANRSPLAANRSPDISYGIASLRSDLSTPSRASEREQAHSRDRWAWHVSETLTTQLYIVTKMRQFRNWRDCSDVLMEAMPIRTKERDFYPDDLFDLPTADAPWEIAHLRSRQEKSVARLLLDGGKPFYLPQIEQTTKRSGRTFVSHLPLFPGYIFLRRVEGLRQTLWRTSAVANMIRVTDQAQLAAELLQIRLLQASGALLTPIMDLAPGDAVRINEGAFSGYAGIVMEERGSLRLIVSVSVLRKSVAVEFPRELLAQMKPGQTGRAQRRI